jgi:cell division protein FtsQ
MAGLILVAGLGVLADRLMDPAAFPIQELSVEGEFRQLEPETVRETVAGAVDGNYFGVELRRVERAAESIDWVREARVRRVWPDGLRVSVREHRLIARWGNHAWLNDHGEVVELESVERPDLLRLAGPEDTAGQVFARAREWARRLDPAGLELRALTLNERRAWYAVMARVENGEIFSLALGRDDVESRFTRFVGAYRALPEDKVAAIDHVDARYPNGIALRLKQGMNS